MPPPSAEGEMGARVRTLDWSTTPVVQGEGSRFTLWLPAGTKPVDAMVQVGTNRLTSA